MNFCVGKNNQVFCNDVWLFNKTIIIKTIVFKFHTTWDFWESLCFQFVLIIELCQIPENKGKHPKLNASKSQGTMYTHLHTHSHFFFRTQSPNSMFLGAGQKL